MKIIESQLEDYPGEFGLPEPFLDRHMRAWWEVAIEPLTGMSGMEFDFYDAEWKGAVQLIREYGKWDVKIKGVSLGDLNTDSVPSEVKTWVMEETSAYVYPFLPFKAKVRLAGTFAN